VALRTGEKPYLLHMRSDPCASSAALAVLLAATALQSPAACLADESQEFTLHLLDDPQSVDLNAVCLDGSPGAFYFKPAAAGFETSWEFYLEGGGWCWSVADCAGRALGGLGSSNGYVPSIPSMGGGLVSSDCEVNPAFCNANQVFFKYCDVNSTTTVTLISTMHASKRH